MNYKTLHRKLKIEQHEPGVNSCASEGLAVPAKVDSIKKGVINIL